MIIVDINNLLIRLEVVEYYKLSIEILYRHLLHSIYEHDIQIIILFIHLIINENIYSYTILFPRAVSNQ